MNWIVIRRYIFYAFIGVYTTIGLTTVMKWLWVVTRH